MSCNHKEPQAAGPTAILAVVREMSVGSHHKCYGPKGVPQAFLANTVTINKLRPRKHPSYVNKELNRSDQF